MITITNEDNMLLMARYPDNYFDLAIVDPPYKIASQQKRGVGSRIDKSGKMNSWNDVLPTFEYFKELFRVSKNQIIWGANNFEGLPRTEYFTVWNKMQSVDNFASLEYAWISMGIGKPAKMFTYSIHKVMAEIKAEGGKIHPTQKPVKLYEWLLMNYAKENDKILDTHLGSGSIAIACHNLKFNLTACELDKDYFEASLKRLHTHQSQLTMF
jgi:site-specific DNA-methyltransferase (adenine-specific)